MFRLSGTHLYRKRWLRGIVQRTSLYSAQKQYEPRLNSWLKFPLLSPRLQRQEFIALTLPGCTINFWIFCAFIELGYVQQFGSTCTQKGFITKIHNFAEKGKNIFSFPTDSQRPKSSCQRLKSELFQVTDESGGMVLWNILFGLDRGILPWVLGDPSLSLIRMCSSHQHTPPHLVKKARSLAFTHWKQNWSLRGQSILTQNVSSENFNKEFHKLSWKNCVLRVAWRVYLPNTAHTWILCFNVLKKEIQPFLKCTST